METVCPEKDLYTGGVGTVTRTAEQTITLLGKLRCSSISLKKIVSLSSTGHTNSRQIVDHVDARKVSWQRLVALVVGVIMLAFWRGQRCAVRLRGRRSR